MKTGVIIILSACAALVSCTRTPPPTESKGATVDKRDFGQTAAGEPVSLFTLTNANGMRAEIITYGGIIRALEVPDRNGRIGDVVLGFDAVDGYLKEHPYFGAIIGRYGNRIAKARFKLGGTEYKLAVNNGPNALHGGVQGFDKRVWTVKDSGAGDNAHLTINYLSKDGEEGYPGNLDVTVTYTMTNDNVLRIDYAATTDKETIANLTNHTYFNFSGADDILAHELKLNASKFTPVDETLIPTGELKDVAGTPFDFRTLTPIGARINQKNQQLVHGKGYDHNFVLDGSGMKAAGEVHDPATGRVMEVSTTEPGIQFYSGNFLDGTITGKGGKVYGNRSGFCLETQHFPDSPNQPSFPTVVLKPGDKYQSTTIYKFSTR
jgi:aldose 1-epimerase